MKKCVYIFKSENGECKIGVSNDVEKRKSMILTQGNVKIVDVFHTPECTNAFKIEKIMHNYYSQYRGLGEWFSIDFKDACNKLTAVFNENATMENTNENINNSCECQQLNTSYTNQIIISVNSDIIRNLDLSNEEISVYIALKSVCSPTRHVQFISYNLIGCELFGHNEYTQNTHGYIVKGLTGLVKRGIVPVVQKLSTTEFMLNTTQLFDVCEREITIRLDEIHTIMNINNRMDKFKLLRYYAICLSTLVNRVGNAGHSFLSEKLGVDYKTNSKLIVQYNDILEKYNLLYINHTQKKFHTDCGYILTIANHYGRYEDKDEIDYATEHCKVEYI